MIRKNKNMLASLNGFKAKQKPNENSRQLQTNPSLHYSVA